MSTPEARTRSNSARSGLVLLLLGVLGAVALLGYLSWRGQVSAQAEAEDALRLQVLASRLGAAALLAEYGDYGQAQAVTSSVFDGIQNYGIEKGALPANYAEVLRARDTVILGLERQSPDVRQRMVDLFFMVQLPADTELDPDRIIPATGAGAGLTAPRRRPSTEVDTASGVPEAAPGGAVTDSGPRRDR